MILSPEAVFFFLSKTLTRQLLQFVLAGMFVYYWIPGVLFQGLSVFSFVTWIRPNNVVLNQLFGGFTGLSLIPLTFDWVSNLILLLHLTIL